MGIHIADEKPCVRPPLGPAGHSPFVGEITSGTPSVFGWGKLSRLSIEI